VEILLWLVPPFVAAVLAMGWVAWVSRERPEVDPDERVRLLGAALDREPRHTERRPAPERERSTGVAVRRVGSE
jgi:hypothetical protein